VCSSDLAVRRAGAIVRDAASRPRRIEHKGRIDLVTGTDLAVEEDLTASLGKILPDAGFLAEETAAAKALGSLTWIIDPLDGTTNFAHNLPVCAISVALWQEGSVVLGIVAVPLLGEVFHSVRGQGAFLNGRPIRVTETSDLEQGLVATGFPYAIRENVRPVVESLGRVLTRARGVRRMGAAAVDLAWTACGRFDAFYEVLLRPWDVAAGWLLVEEAGGRVSDFAGKGFNLGKKSILATNGPLHDEVRALLEPESAFCL